MKFGIVTPIKDSANYFSACAASVANQMLSGETEVFHIAQESSQSEKSCVEAAQKYGIAYSQEDDTGIYDAISRGLTKATQQGCEILSWLNADEQYLPDTIETVANIFRTHPNVDLVFGNYLILGKDGALLAARREIPARLWYLKTGVNYLMSCTVFFRRELWERETGFDLSYKLLADKKFYLTALTHGATCKHVNHYLGVYTATGTNASLAPTAHGEQKRLRREFHAYKSGMLRKAVRLCRCMEKGLAGCYAKTRIDADLYDFAGNPLHVNACVGTAWRWE